MTESWPLPEGRRGVRAEFATWIHVEGEEDYTALCRAGASTFHLPVEASRIYTCPLCREILAGRT